MNKIALINLGCPKNLVDAEHIITKLIQNGYKIVTEYQDADLVIINTCGFINEAIAESLEAIEDALKEHGRVIVTGCLGSKEKWLKERCPKVLAITGPHASDKVLEVVKKYLPQKTRIKKQETIKLTPKHYAYIKISEGCSRNCTFCIIPQLRGFLKSRSIDDVLSEAKNLVESGVKELIVISQDTGAYGSDQNDSKRILTLAKKLAKLPIWIRMHYFYPYPHIDDLMPLMAEHKILPYLDIPLQHVHPRLLKLMKRPVFKENLLKRIHSWRKICPDLAIRSTFIVGFPSETNEEFETLLQFLEEALLDRVGCFKYSPVKGAKANDLPDQIPESLKEERLERLMSLQSQISYDNLQKKIGQTIPVIVDKIDDQIYARSFADAPEIDGQVILPLNKKIHVGDIINIKIKSADEHDLFGKPIRIEDCLS